MIHTLVVSIIALTFANSTSAENRVAVIDTGLNIQSDKYKPFLCKTGHKDFTNTGIADTVGHGTQVVDLIIENAKTKNYCLVIIKFYSTRNSEKQSVSNFLKSLYYSTLLNIKVANLSVSGAGKSVEESMYFKYNPSTVFVTAAGNDGVNLDTKPRYPASYGYNNIIVVGALSDDLKKNKSSNYGTNVFHWEVASATSFATAIATGKYIREHF